MNSNKRICTIGGGSGMPIVNMALILAGLNNFRSIVTTIYNGGDTGRIRTDERGILLANSEVIIMCPGSMYGSVIINLLPKGMNEVYKKSKA